MCIEIWLHIIDIYPRRRHHVTTIHSICILRLVTRHYFEMQNLSGTDCEFEFRMYGKQLFDKKNV